MLRCDAPLREEAPLTGVRYAYKLQDRWDVVASRSSLRKWLHWLKEPVYAGYESPWKMPCGGRTAESHKDLTSSPNWHSLHIPILETSSQPFPFVQRVRFVEYSNLGIPRLLSAP